MKRTLYLLAITCLIFITCKKDDNEPKCTKAPILSEGKDTTVYNGAVLTFSSKANEDSGTWSIIEGTGGTLNKSQDGTQYTFTGANDSIYKLKFEATNDCGTSADTIKVSFVKDCSQLTKGSAGEDINLFNVSKVNLNATAENGTGEWKIVSGGGGKISDLKDPKTEFTGSYGLTYKLQWTVTGLCKTIIDTVSVRFDEVKANAGNDIVIYNNTTVKLRGSLTAGTGEWTILSGNGSFTNNKLGNSEFTGTLNSSNQLVWTVTKNSIVSKDTITVNFVEKGCGTDQSVEQMVQNIHWITQSCFRIEGSSFKVYIDPQGITQKDEADIILVTHSDGDHFSSSDINKLVGPKTIIIAPSNCQYNGVYAKRISMDLNSTIVENGCITIQAVSAYNIVKSGHAHNNTSLGYIITINGVKIYHSGDTERIPEMKTYNCDIAMIPLGQTYTFTSLDEAVEAAKDINPKVIIPMHYGTYEGTDADAASFKTKLSGILNVMIKTKGQ